MVAMDLVRWMKPTARSAPIFLSFQHQCQGPHTPSCLVCSASSASASGAWRYVIEILKQCLLDGDAPCRARIRPRAFEAFCTNSPTVSSGALGVQDANDAQQPPVSAGRDSPSKPLIQAAGATDMASAMPPVHPALDRCCFLTCKTRSQFAALHGLVFAGPLALSFFVDDAEDLP